MSGKRSGSVRGVLLFTFDTPCKVAHHACVLYRAFVPFCTSEADQLFYSIGGDNPAPINLVRGYQGNRRC